MKIDKKHLSPESFLSPPSFGYGCFQHMSPNSQMFKGCSHVIGVRNMSVTIG